MAAKAKEADVEEDEKPEEENEQPASKSKFKFHSEVQVAAAEMDDHRWRWAVWCLSAVAEAPIIFSRAPRHKEPQVTAKPATFVDLPDVLVNLSSSGGDRTQYLKVKIVLELPDSSLVPQIQPLMPRVMDAFQTYLRELRPTDLDGSAGLYRLKEELTRRVNAAVAPNHITAVLFKEIVVQ